MILRNRTLGTCFVLALVLVSAPLSAGEPTIAPKPLDEATYAMRLRDLERRINDLKEKIRLKHTALSLLSESIFGGITAASGMDLVFVNEMSSSFHLTRLVVLYDGSPLATKTDEHDGIASKKEIPIFVDLVQSGDHTIQVLVEYRGNGHGIFSYLDGYKFEVRSSRSFTALPGKTMSLRIVGYNQGGPLTPIEEQPAIRFVEKIRAVGANP